MRIQVEAYAGYKGDQRPIAFVLNRRRLLVEEILDQWYGPHSAYFKVRAADACVYILRLDRFASQGEWTLESFQGQRSG